MGLLAGVGVLAGTGAFDGSEAMGTGRTGATGAGTRGAGTRGSGVPTARGAATVRGSADSGAFTGRDSTPVHRRGPSALPSAFRVGRP
jgi:hypothetical protein